MHVEAGDETRIFVNGVTGGIGWHLGNACRRQLKHDDFEILNISRYPSRGDIVFDLTGGRIYHPWPLTWTGSLFISPQLTSAKMIYKRWSD